MQNQMNQIKEFLGQAQEKTVKTPITLDNNGILSYKGIGFFKVPNKNVLGLVKKLMVSWVNVNGVMINGLGIIYNASTGVGDKMNLKFNMILDNNSKKKFLVAMKAKANDSGLFGGSNGGGSLFGESNNNAGLFGGTNNSLFSDSNSDSGLFSGSNGGNNLFGSSNNNSGLFGKSDSSSNLFAEPKKESIGLFSGSKDTPKVVKIEAGTGFEYLKKNNMPIPSNKIELGRLAGLIPDDVFDDLFELLEHPPKIESSKTEEPETELQKVIEEKVKKEEKVNGKSPEDSFFNTDLFADAEPVEVKTDSKVSETKVLQDKIIEHVDEIIKLKGLMDEQKKLVVEKTKEVVDLKAERVGLKQEMSSIKTERDLLKEEISNLRNQLKVAKAANEKVAPEKKKEPTIEELEPVDFREVNQGIPLMQTLKLAKPCNHLRIKCGDEIYKQVTPTDYLRVK